MNLTNDSNNDNNNNNCNNNNKLIKNGTWNPFSDKTFNENNTLKF